MKYSTLKRLRKLKTKSQRRLGKLLTWLTFASEPGLLVAADREWGRRAARSKCARRDYRHALTLTLESGPSNCDYNKTMPTSVESELQNNTAKCKPVLRAILNPYTRAILEGEAAQ